MASDPNRKFERESGATPAPRDSRASGAGADPWGVKRAENLLTSLTGVLSARVVVSPIGEVEEVHVLTQGGTAPKQVVRNVESALLAHLGIKIDHRKISVAQTAEVRPIEALDQHAVREQALRRGVLFNRIDAQTGSAGRVALHVTLQVGEEEVKGSAEAVDNVRARMIGAGRGAVAALERVLARGTLEVEGVQVVEAFGRRHTLAGVLVVEGRGTRLLVGTCELGDNPEQSAVLAVLDATNRWLASRR
ncbi:MAG TPA: hypothetical protein VFH97_05190 [Gemmatimonadales bacterium]|nr:hypothetical protein [Gemmatimonadales bacterium]